MAIKSVSIRIEEEMLEKLGFVADYEGRSVNSHILVLIRENIKAFEQEHGEIDGKMCIRDSGIGEAANLPQLQPEYGHRNTCLLYTSRCV